MGIYNSTAILSNRNIILLRELDIITVIGNVVLSMC